MFGFIAVFTFVLFFILILVVKDEKLRSKIVKVYLIVILGGLFLAGCGSLLTGTIEALLGKTDMGQFLLQVFIGFLLMAAGGIPLYLYFISKEVSIRRLEKRKKKHPDAPWMWVDHWSTNKMVYSGKGPIGFGWFVLLVMTGGLAAVSYANREKIFSRMEESSFEVIAFYSIFFLILLVGFYAVFSLLRGYWKFGKSTFEMSIYPGLIGGELAGTIQTHMKTLPERGFDLELQCGLVDLTSRVGRRSGHTRPALSLWQANKKVRLEEVRLGAEGVSIPVSFSIPAGAQESDAWSLDKRIVWTLSAFSSLGGSQYLSQFDVSVFKARPIGK